MRPRPCRTDDLRGGQLSRAFLIDILVARYERRASQIDVVNAMSLYPDEVRAGAGAARAAATERLAI